MTDCFFPGCQNSADPRWGGYCDGHGVTTTKALVERTCDERDSAIRRAEEAEKDYAGARESITRRLFEIGALRDELAAQVKDHDDTYEQLHAAQAECIRLRRALAEVRPLDVLLSQPSCFAPLLQAIKGAVECLEQEHEPRHPECLPCAALKFLRPYVTEAK